MWRQILVAVLVVMVFLWIDTGRRDPISHEAFEPDTYALTNTIMKTLEQKGVRFASNGVKNVTPIDVVMDKPRNENMMQTLIGATPAFVSRASARLRIITRGGDIVLTPTFVVQGRGETRVASQRDASLGIYTVATSVRDRLTSG